MASRANLDKTSHLLSCFLVKLRRRGIKVVLVLEMVIC